MFSNSEDYAYLNGYDCDGCNKDLLMDNVRDSSKICQYGPPKDEAYDVSTITTQSNILKLQGFGNMYAFAEHF